MKTQEELEEDKLTEQLQKELLYMEISKMKIDLYKKLTMEKSPIDNNFLWDKDWLEKIYLKKMEYKLCKK